MASSAATLVGILQDVLGRPDKPVGLHEPHFAGQEWAYVKECIDTGWVSYVGSYVNLFEEKIARACGVSHAVVTVSGTAALHIALNLAGVSQEDEVLMPSLTFIATANAAAYCGAVPHFVDCDEKTLGVDAAKLSDYIASIAEKRGDGVYNKHTGRRIAALAPVHIFGHPADMDSLQAIADHYNLPVVEDAAESLGSLYKGRPAGSMGKLGILSFNGNKIVTTGGGGAILTNDSSLAARAKHLTTTAKKLHRWAFDHDEIGYNYRMPNINAAMGCAQMEQLEGFLAAKRRLADIYEAAFQASPDIGFFREPAFARSNYWLNAIILKPKTDRDEVLQSLHDVGYLCRPVWTLLHKQKMYQDCPRMDLAVSEDLEARIINLPSSVRFGL